MPNPLQPDVKAFFYCVAGLLVAQIAKLLLTHPAGSGLQGPGLKIFAKDSALGFGHMGTKWYFQTCLMFVLS